MKKVVRMWIGIGLGGLVGLVVFVVIVGLCLPESYRAKGRLDVGLPPEAVWKLISDFEAHPISANMARSVEALPDVDGLPSWNEDIGSTVITVTTVEEVAPQRLVRRMTDRIVPMTATWSFRIEPLDSGSRIWVENQTEIRRGTWHVPIFRLMMTMTRGAEKGVEAYLKQLGGELSGTPVQWERTESQP